MEQMEHHLHSVCALKQKAFSRHALRKHDALKSTASMELGTLKFKLMVNTYILSRFYKAEFKKILILKVRVRGTLDEA